MQDMLGYPCSSGISIVLKSTNMTLGYNYNTEISYIQHMTNIPYNGDADEFLPKNRSCSQK